MKKLVTSRIRPALGALLTAKAKDERNGGEIFIPESGFLKNFYRYFLESSVIFIDMIVLDPDFLLPFFSVLFKTSIIIKWLQRWI